MDIASIRAAAGWSGWPYTSRSLFSALPFTTVLHGGASTSLRHISVRISILFYFALPFGDGWDRHFFCTAYCLCLRHQRRFSWTSLLGLKYSGCRLLSWFYRFVPRALFALRRVGHFCFFLHPCTIVPLIWLYNQAETRCHEPSDFSHCDPRSSVSKLPGAASPGWSRTGPAGTGAAWCTGPPDTRAYRVGQGAGHVAGAPKVWQASSACYAFLLP